jgi:hypothetical protein
MTAIPERYALPSLAKAEIDARVALAAAVEDRAPGAVRAFFARTGRLLGWLDVRRAAGANGIEALVRRLAAQDLPEQVTMSEDESVALLAALAGAALGPAESEHAIALLEAHWDQAHVSDLVFWPSARAPRDAAGLAALARSTRGRALAPYLDAMCAPVDPGTIVRPSAAALARVRPVLVDMAEASELELASGEPLAHALALALPRLGDAAALGAWLVEEHPGVSVGELFADDEALAPRWRALNA